MNSYTDVYEQYECVTKYSSEWEHKKIITNTFQTECNTERVIWFKESEAGFVIYVIYKCTVYTFSFKYERGTTCTMDWVVSKYFAANIAADIMLK